MESTQMATDDWIKKTGYIYTMEHYSAKTEEKGREEGGKET